MSTSTGISVQNATITAGNTTIVVNHTLGTISAIVLVMMQDDLGGRSWFITNMTI